MAPRGEVGDDTGGKATETVSKQVISDLKLSLHANELVAVVGPVGSGKTSLLLGLLGELAGGDLETNSESGTVAAGARVKTGSRVAYVPQESWIQSATLRDNVLIGGCGEAQADPRRSATTSELCGSMNRGTLLPFDRGLYDRVIDGACLTTDLQQLEGGDMAELGERGVTVSGGQKARICLARAMYALPDVYLLDDPLSAVDAHTGERLFNDAISGFMLGRSAVAAAGNTEHPAGAKSA